MDERRLCEAAGCIWNGCRQARDRNGLPMWVCNYHYREAHLLDRNEQ